MAKGCESMKLSGIALTMGIGAAAGAVAVMMLPKQSTARKLASKAADKVELAAWKAGNKINQLVDM